ncbi:Protein of unknown function, partial [Cotesia congregata]
STTNHEFNTRTSVTLKSLNIDKTKYNNDLIYDDKYFKCVVNPKRSDKIKFEKENPGVKVIECPAHLTFRTTKDKQALVITQFEPNHDHDSSNKISRLKEAKDKIIANTIRSANITHSEEINEPSASSSQSNLQNKQQIHSSVITGANDEVTSSTLQVASTITDDEIPYAPVIDDDDDDFKFLLKQLDLNIASSTDEEKQMRKISLLTEIINKYNDIDVASKIGTLSVCLSRSRGRNRGRKNRVASFPENTRNILTFDELSVVKKKIYLIKLILNDKNLIESVLTKLKKISTAELTHLIPNIPDALGSETIKFEILEEFFEKDAFKSFKKSVSKKRESPHWSCNQCEKDLGTSDSIECDKCLFWSHFVCVDLVQEPPNTWFCPKCKSEKK